MAANLISRIKSWINQSEFRFQILRGGGISLVIQVAFAGMSFVTASVMAQFMGADGYGTYSNAQSWTNVLIPVALMGLGGLAIRNFSIYSSRKDWKAFHGLILFSDRVVILFSIILIALIFGASFIIYNSPDEIQMRTTLWVGLLLIPLMALIQIRQGTLRGMEHVTRSLLSDQIIRPTLLLVGVVGLYLMAAKFLTAPTAMLINVIAAAAALAVASFWQRKLTPTEVFTAAPIYHQAEWLKAAFPMMLSTSLNLVLSQTSPIMLGIMDNAAAVGLFSAAYKIAYLAIFVPMAIGYVISPLFARLYANGEMEKLQKLLTVSTRITFAACLAISVIFILGSNFLLSLFGPEFTAARIAFFVLVLGNQLDVTFGYSTLLLNMTGYQKSVAIIFGIFSAVNIILNVVLIPILSYEGAAIASTASLVMSRVVLLIYTRKNLKLNPSVF